jgi:hypothetical protein
MTFKKLHALLLAPRELSWVRCIRVEQYRRAAWRSTGFCASRHVCRAFYQVERPWLLVSEAGEALLCNDAIVNLPSILSTIYLAPTANPRVHTTGHQSSSL